MYDSIIVSLNRPLAGIERRSSKFSKATGELSHVAEGRSFSSGPPRRSSSIYLEKLYMEILKKLSEF